MIQTAKNYRRKKRRSVAHVVWKKVFYNIDRKYPSPKTFTLSEVVELLDRDRVVKITRESLRVKLARYVSKGYLVKIKRATYRISNEGGIYFGLLETKSKKEGEYDYY